MRRERDGVSDDKQIYVGGRGRGKIKERFIGSIQRQRQRQMQRAEAEAKAAATF